MSHVGCIVAVFTTDFFFLFFFFSSRRRHTRSDRDWSSDVCSSDLGRSKVARVVFLPVGPTKCQYSVHQVRERAFKVVVNPRAQFGERLWGKRFALDRKSVV